LAVGVLLFLIFFNQGVWRTFERKREIRDLERQIARVQEESLDTKKKIDSYKSDKLYLDVLTQKELGYLKPDEIEIRFVPAPSQNN
jgi:cell division protein FtsB